MNIQFYAKNFELTQEVKDYINEKLEKVLKQAGDLSNDIRLIHVDISENFSHTPEQLVRLEINVDLLTDQKVIRIEERAIDIQTAMDVAEEELVRQIKKYKGRNRALNLRDARFFKYLKLIDPIAFIKRIRYGKKDQEE